MPVKLILIGLLLFLVLVLPVRAQMSTDLNSDGKVDSVDTRLLLGKWLTETFDLSGDSKTNSLDFGWILRDWGLEPMATPTLTVAPTITPTPVSSLSSTEWSQFAHDAQRTGYQPDLPSQPWKFAWQWNGSNDTGGEAEGHVKLPRLVQVVTGDNKAYIPYGDGITARNETDGSQAWQVSLGGLVASAVYDQETKSVFVGSLDGFVYKLSSTDGGTTSSFNTGGMIKTPVLLEGNFIYVSSTNSLFKINKQTMQKEWRYDAGAFIQQMPAYSASKDLLVVGSSSKEKVGDYQNLNVIAINNSDGSEKWRVNPNPDLKYQPADSFDPEQEAVDTIEWEYGWPVIAEKHGLVLMQLRSLSWYQFAGSVRLSTNGRWKQFFEKNPKHRKLYVLDLDDGSQPFLTAVLNAGYNGGNFSPMGPQPVVKTWPNGDEVAYTITFNSTIGPFGKPGECVDVHKWQCGAGFAEIILDDQTIPGYKGGDVRLIETYTGTSALQAGENGPMTMAGNMLFHSHWAMASGQRIVDRSDSLGMPYSNAIKAGRPFFGYGKDADFYVLAENNALTTCPFDNGTHYCPDLIGWEHGARVYQNGGYYIYSTTDKIYDKYWGEGSYITVSNGRVYYRSVDGGILVLESGTP